MTALLRLLGIPSADDQEMIRGLRRAYRELDIVRHRRMWRAYWLEGTAEPVSGRTPAELAAAIREAWVATGPRQ